MLDFFLSLKTMQISIMPRGCENESSVCDGLWPVVWEEVLPRLNRVMFLQFFPFPKYLQRKSPKSRTDPEERRQKQRNTTDVEEYETVYLQKETRR